MIPYGRQWLDAEDERAVLDALRSDYLTQGPKIAEFERALCEYTGAKYCVVVASGTAALHLAVAAMELPAGSEGITSCNTFTASANSMVYCGVRPVFADIDPVSYNLDPASVAKRITSATRLLTPVHFAGQPAEMEALAQLARERGLRVIEDAAHAIGSRYRNGRQVGCCQYSDATVFSFHPVKTLTTGEGGAVMTNDAELYRKMVLLRTHGITKDPELLTQHPGPWYYEMHALGFHYRMTDMQAALGISQLKKLEAFAARRRQIVALYNEYLADFPWLTRPVEADGVSSCFHLYVVQIDFEGLEKSRADVMRELAENGVGSQVHYIPVHTQPWYQTTYGYDHGDCPVAEAYYQRCLSLPLYPAMSDEDVTKVVDVVRRLVA